jgi:hypothetical protein
LKTGNEKLEKADVNVKFSGIAKIIGKKNAKTPEEWWRSGQMIRGACQL